MFDEADDFFASLDAEIAQHTAKAKIKDDAAKAKARANNTRLASSARREAAKTFHELSALIESDLWSKLSTIALFVDQQCDGCGSRHRVFLQYMEKHCMTRNPSTTHFVRVAKPDPTLPREVLCQPAITHICADCCNEHGFDLNASGTIDFGGQLSPSKDYEQEDINAQTS